MENTSLGSGASPERLRTGADARTQHSQSPRAQSAVITSLQSAPQSPPPSPSASALQVAPGTATVTATAPAPETATAGQAVSSNLVRTELRQKDTERETEIICRYCFDGADAGELIAPCKCAGGQRWVHLSCLRRWQRGILVSQPTHPDSYDDDVRHCICGVCKTPFSCKPPTRFELMQTFTGGELAALVEEGCLIGTHSSFTAELQRQMGRLPEHLQDVVGDSHWINGVFFIHRVIEDRASGMQLRILDEEDLASFADALSEDMRWRFRDRDYTLLFDGPLRSVSAGSVEEKRAAVRGLESPCSLRLAPADEGDCSEDSIMAVNLTRPISLKETLHTPKRLHFQNLVRRVLPDEELLPLVTHFLGGPCSKHRVQAALVIAPGAWCGEDGGDSEDYRVFTKVSLAIPAAQELCKKRRQCLGPSAIATTMPAASSVGEADVATPNLVAAAADSPAAIPEVNAAVVTSLLVRENEVGSVVAAKSEVATDAAAALDVTLEPPAKRRRDGELLVSTPTAVSTTSVCGREGRNSGTTVDNGACNVQLHIFWGAAGWSRCQLMGEIASGSWGLCKSTPADVIRTKPESLHQQVYPRFVFAPKTEMTETYDTETSVEEDRARVLQYERVLRRRQQRAAAAAEAAAVAATFGNISNGDDGDGPTTSHRAAVLTARDASATEMPSGGESSSNEDVEAVFGVTSSDEDDEDSEEDDDEEEEEEEDGEDEEPGSGEEEEAGEDREEEDVGDTAATVRGSRVAGER
eukprot:TRINITY_DN68135_c0_g1_i1.p1 TRINITY_DN68135_c0_g1~~TRINITY_DN68135_c0_g1_i1.p1  ORF type:complete len:754 (+),score=150.76 TRINITY_DN68135_c0_g1_i1:214-2475(+)